MKKLLLLDLDGTVRETKSGKTFINEPLDQKLIDRVTERLDEAISDSWRIVGISNQGGIEKGYISIDEAIAGMRQTIDLAPQITDIYFCPNMTPPGSAVCRCGYRGDTNSWGYLWVDLQNYPDIQSGYRKPEPGMLLMAIEDCVFPPSRILYVGDREEDRLAAEAANVEFLDAEDWRNEGLTDAMYSSSDRPLPVSRPNP